MLCHEASPPDPALLTLGRGIATRRQMVPMVGNSCLPQDGMTGGLLHLGFTQTLDEFVAFHSINITPLSGFTVSDLEISACY